MTNEDLEDRRVSFDCLLTVVAKNKELSTSIPVLIFLGIDLLADRKYAKRRKEYLKKQEEKGAKDVAANKDDDQELFSQDSSKKSPMEEEDLFKDPPKSLSKDVDGVN